MRVVPLALAVLFVLPSVGAWTQFRGEADRSTAIEPPRGTLDIASITPFLPDNHAFNGRLSPYAVSTSNGLVGLSVNEHGLCDFIVGGPDQVSLSIAPPGCDKGQLQGYWPGGDAFLTCRPALADEPVLGLFGLQGTSPWEEDFTPDGRLGQVEPENSVYYQYSGRWNWSCDGAAIIGDFAVVPFYATRTSSDSARHRIAKVSLIDGTTEWTTEITAAAIASALPGPAPLPPVPAPSGVPVSGGVPSFMPTAVTATENGYLVTGLVVCPSAPTMYSCRSGLQTGGGTTSYMGAVAWLNLAGQVLGFEVPQPRVVPEPEAENQLIVAPMVSVHGAAQHGVIATQVGGRILFIDPSRSDLEAVLVAPVLESRDALSAWAAPVWQEHRIAIPTDRQILFVDTGYNLLPDPWDTPGRSDEHIVDIVGDQLGRLFILSIAVPNATALTTDTAFVTILDRDGHDTHRLPLPAGTMVVSDPILQTGGVPSMQWRQTPVFAVHDGQLLVIDPLGRIFLLADHGKGPPLDVSDLYPRSGDLVKLDVEATGNPVRLILRWEGDIVEETSWPAGQQSVRAEHLYVNSGDASMLVTIVDQDGTTSTATRIVHVDGVPPPEKFIEKAFSAEYRDTTWGIIGIAIAGLGALFGFIQLRRGRNRLRRDFERLHAIREKGRTDTIGALRDLQAMRQHVHDHTAAGGYDQGQLHLLEARMASTARTLLFQSVATFRDRLTPLYQGMLSSFFEDGRIGEHEAETALDGLTRQKRLTAAEKETLQAMFETLKA